MVSAKTATSGLIKIKIFGKIGYGAIISVHNFTNKISSPDSYYNVNVVM